MKKIIQSLAIFALIVPMVLLLTACGNNARTEPSDRHATPTNVRIENGRLRWDNVSTATHHTVIAFVDGEFLSSFTEHITHEHGFGVNSLNLQNILRMDELPLTPRDTMPTFELRVSAQATANYWASHFSEPATFEITHQLSAPTNVRIENETLYWDATNEDGLASFMIFGWYNNKVNDDRAFASAGANVRSFSLSDFPGITSADHIEIFAQSNSYRILASHSVLVPMS